MSIYRGFSTFNRVKKFRVTDESLIKQDLINHFNIKQGDKLMRPKFGTIIWNLLFEPLTEATKQVVIDDVKRVVSYDPRTSVDRVIVTEYEHGLQVEVELRYRQTDQVDTLKMQFDRESRSIR